MKYLSREEGSRKLLAELLAKNKVGGNIEEEISSMSSAQLTNRLLYGNGDIYLSRFLTKNQDMLKMKEMARRLVLYDDPVLITGPTGVGKEIIARALHGNRSDDFLPLNCAGFSETLLESDLFGHVKGAFTDAKETKEGALVTVGEGTVLLDEADRMPLSIQSKLLRAIQEREVRPVGSSRYIQINCRFVFTAKHDLLEKVKRGEFLPDLYGRIMTFHLKITPLRDRPEDIEYILTTPEKEGGLGIPSKYLPMPEEYNELVDLFNVRALIAYQRYIQVFVQPFDKNG